MKNSGRLLPVKPNTNIKSRTLLITYPPRVAPSSSHSHLFFLSRKSATARSKSAMPVESNLFSGNAVTVVNFWFTGCKPCVAELSKLNELNDAIKSMGGEVVGINTETFDGNKTAIKEAASVLESQGVKYRNLSIDSSSAAGKYASEIMAFPTTILVDRNGNIVGEPMLGGIDNQDNYDTLMKQIQSVIDADSTNK